MGQKLLFVGAGAIGSYLGAFLSRSVGEIEILRRRLEMYRSLREDTVARLGQARYDE
ncbi:MAG: hypothetical protein Q8R92_19575 [Deltaproteobacteria bacterium]|nr:hypothetical protein [Deltaproteobacteria bacterium]